MTDRIFLKKGAHDTLADGGCAMEFVAWVAGEPHSDHPVCVSPVIQEFCRQWNDALNDTDRQMLVPLLLDAIGTNTGIANDKTRAWMCGDWLVRVHAPAWLRLAKLDNQARALEGLARIVDATTVGRAQHAAWAAAWDAAGYAAGAAAWDAAWDAAGDAARAAAGDAARDAARDAALRPTVEMLQHSALDLLRAMCAVGRNPEPIIEERAALVRACVP